MSSMEEKFYAGLKKSNEVDPYKRISRMIKYYLQLSIDNRIDENEREAYKYMERFLSLLLVYYMCNSSLTKNIITTIDYLSILIHNLEVVRLNYRLDNFNNHDYILTIDNVFTVYIYISSEECIDNEDITLGFKF